MPLCVPYIIACKCRLICGVFLCGVLLIIIIGNYNYLCRVPGAVRFYCVCVACSVCLFRTESPPPQMKTLKTKRVFLYRAALVPVIGKAIQNFVTSLSFRI